jgi:O-antigen ligase
VLLAVICLDIPLQFDVHLAYREEVSDFGSLVGINLSITTLCLAVLYTTWALQLLSGAAQVARPNVRASLPAAAYLTIVALSTLWARDPMLAVFSVALIGQMYLLYLYVASTVRSREDVLFIVAFLLIGLIVESLLITFMRVTGSDLGLEGMTGRVEFDRAAPGENRVSGTLGSPAAAAAYLSMLMAPAVGVLLTRLDHRLKLLAAGALALGGVSLIFTLTRGGWIAAALAVTLLCVLAWRRGWLPLYVPLMVCATVALIGIAFQSTILVRFFGDDRGAALARVHLMELAWNMIQDQPLLGVGANNFAFMIKEYATPEFGGKWLYTVHNAYYLTWAEIGLGGLLALVVFLTVSILRGWRVWQFRDRALSPIALGFTAAFIGHMSHLFVDVFNARPHFQLVWLIAGLLAALATRVPFESSATVTLPKRLRSIRPFRSPAKAGAP